MANRLKMAKIQAIYGLLALGWSYRRIGRELGVHRDTVAKYDQQRPPADSKPATNPPPGSDAPPGGDDFPQPDPKPATNPTAGSGPPSQCAPFHEVIVAKLDQGLSGQRIWQDLVEDHAFPYSYSSVKRYVRRLGQTSPLPFRRIEVLPGAEGQIDFGQGAWVIGPNGRKRRPHVIRIVLGHSRKGYSESVWKQDAENFLRVLENAFESFGGVFQTLVPDNTKAAVILADWYDPELNPKLLDFARHYGFTVLPTRPYTPRHKGKVERGIDYVQNNALKGRSFGRLEEQNEFLAKWERTVADTRIHGTTRRQVKKAFEEVERPALRPLPAERFACFEEGKRKVHRDGHVEVARAYYSVPPEYLGHTLWVRWDLRLVRIYNERLVQIAVHPRAKSGRFQTQPGHLADEKISMVEKGAEHMLRQTRQLGEDAYQWAQAMIEERGIEGVRVLQGFLALARRHPAPVLNQVSRIALETGCFRLRPLRELCRRTTVQPLLPFLEEHPIIRPLSIYQRLLDVPHVSFRPDEPTHEERKDTDESATDLATQTPAPLGDDRGPGGPPAGSPGQSTQSPGVPRTPSP